MSKSFRKSAQMNARFLHSLVLSASLMTACGFFLGEQPVTAQASTEKKSDAVSVKLVQPRKGDVARQITLQGNVVANQQVTLYSKVTGYLKSIAFDYGDDVKKGDLIAEIEAPELIAELAKFKAELEIAELDYKRAVDAQKRSPDLIVAQSLDAAKSKVAMAKANLERSETLLNYCKITAPFSGVVTRRYVDSGAFVPAASASSSPASAALVTIADFNTVRVQIPVPELEASRVQKGLPVKVTVEGLPGKIFEGTVTRFARVLDEATRTMLVEVSLSNSNGELRPGMYALAKIGIEKHSDTLLLPTEAVLMEKAGASVFTVDGGKAKKIPVKTGFNDGSFVEVLSGIQPSDSVILVGKMPLTTGQPINVTEGK